MVTFNYANIHKDDAGNEFLNLEIQGVFNGQTIIVRNCFPATINNQTRVCQVQDTERQPNNDNQTEESQ